jgi:hypothetical protein
MSSAETRLALPSACFFLRNAIKTWILALPNAVSGNYSPLLLP